MKYEDFRGCWDTSMRQSGFFTLGSAKETLDLGYLDRRYETCVEPIGGQDAKPFYVTARLQWRWDALNTARMATIEEDVLTTLLGQEHVADDIATAQPWLRVDVTLAGKLGWGKSIALPRQTARATWAREVIVRLEQLEPLLPQETSHVSPEGSLEILGWQGKPELEIECSADGHLKLSGVKLSAWQALDLPRQWDDPEREPDEGPERQLAEFFARVRQALHVWMECLDVLLAPDPE